MDVRITDGVVAQLGAGIHAPMGAEEIDAEGGALLPGLWDHHIHLLAMAARAQSVDVGRPNVNDRDGFVAALRTAAAGRPAGTWIRAVGYHESLSGALDRHLLDQVVRDHPTRVQHRSGALWVLNTRALALLGIAEGAEEGIERDRRGEPTGRLYGLDHWLGQRLPHGPAPDLAPVGRRLVARGVVGVTDATPYEAFGDLAPLAEAVGNGDLPLRVMATGGPSLTEVEFPPQLAQGPVKLVLADHRLPGLDQTAAWIERAHHAGRAVAVHSVTAASLVLVLAAFETAGSRPGDRIEHGAVVPPELRQIVAQQGLTIVTQPHFVAERGDEYLAEVDPADRPHLYPCATLLDAGVAVAGSTDAPFGDPDPWRAMAAAVERRTETGADIGRHEAVEPARALDLFLGRPEDPGGPVRPMCVGAPADLCLLRQPRREVHADPRSARVAATVIGGVVVHRD
ncbi:MAG: amidohydrolase family protein [Acidimicrobiales bacterium]